ncbi:helix-turn-helix domain-containing protein [bacterium]|nr:helix-turn-helix domain-containing protein [candidate division CSSED10-310 bacterium]
MEFKEAVRLHRKRKRLTQKQLAKLAGLDISMIVRIEGGETKTVKSDALRRLAEALEVSADELIGRKMGLTIEDIIRLNPAAEDIFEGYANLSPNGREMVKTFIAFLLTREMKEIHELKSDSDEEKGSETTGDERPNQVGRMIYGDNWDRNHGDSN